ncbi:hypothetical protein LILAB_16525 [Corallococcus macrosporus]|uniref:Lipoprotein n=2 Tax=Myxococcaceae TaxID=31 RepID=F8CL83_MYXFH|nr:hypothetical protein LILAB_16525 [Corallococcus macrosporus]
MASARKPCSHYALPAPMHSLANSSLLLSLLLPCLALAQPTDDAPRRQELDGAPPQRPEAPQRAAPTRTAAPLRMSAPHDEPFPLGARLVGESVGGALIGATGLAVAFLGGVLVTDQVSCGYSECRKGRSVSLLSASIGMGLGAASGVYLGGSLMDARGGLLPTLLGGLAGTAAPLALVALSDGDVSWGALTATFAVPVATSILAFELSHGADQRRRREERPVMVPTVSLAPGGGALGLTGRF